jgi:hypothetical protein
VEIQGKAMKVNILSQTYLLYDSDINVRQVLNFKAYDLKVVGQMFVFNIVLADHCYIEQCEYMQIRAKVV